MYLKDILEWVKDNPTVVQVDSFANQALKDTWIYSEKFYNLADDIADLYVEKYKTPNPNLSELLSEDLEEGILLTKELKEKISEWMKTVNVLNNQEQQIKDVSLASLALKFCREKLSHSGSSSQSSKSATPKDASKNLHFDPKNLSKLFQPLHFEALEEMVTKLSTQGNSCIPNYSPSVLNRIELKWENMLVSNYYQLIAKEIYRHYQEILQNSVTEKNGKSKKNSFPTNCVLLLLHPTKIFDGLLFHSLLSQKTKSLEKEKVPAERDSEKKTDHMSNEKKKNPATSTHNQELPIDKYKEEILHRIDRDRVVVLCGETG
jgi:hypothetical protein